MESRLAEILARRALSGPVGGAPYVTMSLSNVTEQAHDLHYPRIDLALHGSVVAAASLQYSSTSLALHTRYSARADRFDHFLRPGQQECLVSVTRPGPDRPATDGRPHPDRTWFSPDRFDSLETRILIVRISISPASRSSAATSLHVPLAGTLRAHCDITWATTLPVPASWPPSVDLRPV